jgi:hypothetical protein
MSTMKKHTAIGVTVSVLVATLGSAAAVAYDLSRTPRLPSATSELAAPFKPAPAGFAQPVSGLQPVLYIPTLTIVGRFHPPPVVRAARALKAAADTAQMQCTSWRELDMGSGRVQVCE